MSDIARSDATGPGDTRQQLVLWKVGAEAPSPDRFKPITDSTRRKPTGGLWTSTWLGAAELSGWAEWCRIEDFGAVECDAWLLTPDADAEVYTVDTYSDLAYLHHCYGNSRRIGDSDLFECYLDWPLVAERFAGVHLTDEGQWRTRLTMPYDLYGWDCESTLWFRWAFSEVEHIGRVNVHEQSEYDGHDQGERDV